MARSLAWYHLLHDSQKVKVPLLRNLSREVRYPICNLEGSLLATMASNLVGNKIRGRNITYGSGSGSNPGKNILI